MIRIEELWNNWEGWVDPGGIRNEGGIMAGLGIEIIECFGMRKHLLWD